MAATIVASTIETASQFVDAINQHDLAALARLMADDHEFVDSLGTCVPGRALVAAAWRTYFKMVPDYTLRVDESFVQGDVAVLLGTAGGTYAGAATDGRWQTPAAVRAVVRDGRVAQWRIYADNEPIRQLMAGN